MSAPTSERFLRIASATLLFLIPGSSFAENVTFYSGGTLTSNYVSNGISQSDDKPAIQAYLEAEAEGFYAGTWLSSVNFDTGDRLEVDLYLGYRNTFSNSVYVRADYARYLYNQTGDCCGEFRFSLGYTLQQLQMVGYVAYNPDGGTFNKRATLAYSVRDKVGFSGTYGNKQSTNNKYWDAGFTYAINDFVSADLRYHDAQIGFQGIVVSISTSTQQDTFTRQLLQPFRR